MKPILIVYSSTDGQTLRICERLQAVLAQRQLPVQVMPIAAAQTLDLAAFGVVLLGASVRYGRHRPEVYRFVTQHKAVLQRQPVVFLSVNAVARKPEKRSAQSNPYVRKFLRQTAWQPQHVAVLAGRIDYPRYGWLDKQVIRLIMWLTNGPSDGHRCHEFTDWQEVEALAQTVAQLAEQTVVKQAPLNGPTQRADQTANLSESSRAKEPVAMAHPAESSAAAKGAAGSAAVVGALSAPAQAQVQSPPAKAG